jgi:ribosomal protein S18 acetylase RimI-like enzyme
MRAVAVSTPQLRRASAQDVPALAGVLARAFLDDPVASWAYPPDHLRERALVRFQGTRARQLLGEEEVWTDSDLRCAALWATPGRWKMSLGEIAALAPSFMHPRLIARLPIAAIGWEKLERRHPPDPPHWYLAVLGTDPSAQGQGLGSAVLRPVLERCDADGVGAYLESSKESNIAFYSRHGFRVTEEIRLLKGPPMWKMWRDPRS